MRRRLSALGEDVGTTLLEIVIAVMIMGIGTTAVLGAMGTAISTSSMHRQQTVAGRILDNFAEHMKSEVSAPYVSCTASPGAPAAYAGYRDAFVALAAAASTASTPNNVHEPEIGRYTLSVAVSAGVPAATLGADPGVTYPDPSAPGACSSTDEGIQQLTLTVTTPDGRAGESVAITKWSRS